MSTRSSRRKALSNQGDLAHADFFASVRPPEPPLPPVFPTMTELVLEAQVEARKAPMTRRLLDLYDGTLGDPAPLLEDFVQHPQKYGEEQAHLLEQLMSGSTSIPLLSKTERLVLNLAVIDYMAPVPPTPAPVVKTAQKRSHDEDDDEYELEKNGEPETRAGEMPETELPAHWWLNS